MTEFNAQIIEEFRGNAGQLGGGFKAAPMVLLTTRGAKSGNLRTNPLVYLQEGIASTSSGRRAALPPTRPGTTTSSPTRRVTVEIGSETYEADAVEVTGAEHDRILRGPGGEDARVQGLRGQDQAGDPRGRAPAGELNGRSGAARDRAGLKV